MTEEVNKNDHNDVLRMAVDIVSAYVAYNTVPATQVPDVINTVYKSLTSLDGGGKAAAEAVKPAISVRRSVTPDFIVCLEDGKKLKMLKRHLKSAYDLTPDQYRERWGLASDYPMVAPNYAEQRRDLAKKIGLGTSRSRRGSV